MIRDLGHEKRLFKTYVFWNDTYFALNDYDVDVGYASTILIDKTEVRSIYIE